MDLTRLKWMDYSGSPILFLPKHLATEWLGFYAEVEDGFSGEPDLELNGVQYTIDDTFDFEHPRTDYDCICAIEKEFFTYSIGHEKVLVISSFYDSLAWIDAKQMLINGRLDELREAVLSTLVWEDSLEWEVTAKNLFLMNACLCPLSPDFDDQDFDEIELKPGKYRVERASYEEDYCAILYRFIRIE